MFLNDIIKSTKAVGLWFLMSWQETLGRYKRSYIGPFWITLQMLAFSLALALLYGALFNLDLQTLLPKIATGLVIWNTIAALIVEGSYAFISAAPMYKSTPTPLFGAIYRILSRNLIVFVHNLIGCALVLILLKVDVSVFGFLFFILGLGLLYVFGFFLVFVVGALGVKYRDLPEILNAFTQIVFYLTPVFWDKALLNKHKFLADLNPFYHYLTAIRQPLLEGTIPLDSFIWVLGSALAFGIIAFLLFKRTKEQLYFYL